MRFEDPIRFRRERALGPGRRREDPVRSPQREMHRPLPDFGRSLDGAPCAAWQAERFQSRFDLRESDDEVIVSAELPGPEDEDFELSVADGVLVPTGEKPGEHTDKRQGAPLHRERAHGAFERQPALP